MSRMVKRKESRIEFCIVNILPAIQASEKYRIIISGVFSFSVKKRYAELYSIKNYFFLIDKNINSNKQLNCQQERRYRPLQRQRQINIFKSDKQTERLKIKRKAEIQHNNNF